MTTTLERLLEHDRWATRRLLDAARTLTPGQLHELLDIGPGSVHDTLRHIVGAMRRWADRIEQRELRPSIEQESSPRSVDELMALHDEAASDIARIARDLERDHRLDESFEFIIRGWKGVFRVTFGTALVHLMTHGTHHRAQCLNMMRRLGAAPDALPEIDAIEWELQTRDAMPAAED
jgi:uncharacterized damage-inducible protein DinB